MTYAEGVQKAVEHFGYVVIGFDPDTGEVPRYIPGQETLNVWNRGAPEAYVVIGNAFREDWIKQAEFLLSEGAELINSATKPPERGALFCKLVPVSSSLNPFREKAHAGGNGE